jgi:hypothetical protein
MVCEGVAESGSDGSGAISNEQRFEKVINSFLGSAGSEYVENCNAYGRAVGYIFTLEAHAPMNWLVQFVAKLLYFFGDNLISPSYSPSVRA